MEDGVMLEYGERLNERDANVVNLVLARLKELRDNPYLNPEANAKEAGVIFDLLLSAVVHQN